MKMTPTRVYLSIGLIVLLLAGSTMTSCTANQPRSAWMDLPHARQLDKLKGKQAKALQKHVAKTNHY